MRSAFLILRLNDIYDLLVSKSSSFTRLKVENPRYEKIDIHLDVQMNPTYDAPYFQTKLAADIRDFLAPWRTGRMRDMQFGRKIKKADLIHFIECSVYVDFITFLQWTHQASGSTGADVLYPLTARSILMDGLVHVSKYNHSISCVADRHTHDNTMDCTEEPKNSSDEN